MNALGFGVSLFVSMTLFAAVLYNALVIHITGSLLPVDPWPVWMMAAVAGGATLWTAVAAHRWRHRAGFDGVLVILVMTAVIGVWRPSDHLGWLIYFFWPYYLGLACMVSAYLICMVAFRRTRFLGDLEIDDFGRDTTL